MPLAEDPSNVKGEPHSREQEAAIAAHVRKVLLKLVNRKEQGHRD
jgi:hypothetical protein